MSAFDGARGESAPTPVASEGRTRAGFVDHRSRVVSLAKLPVTRDGTAVMSHVGDKSHGASSPSPRCAAAFIAA